MPIEPNGWDGFEEPEPQFDPGEFHEEDPEALEQDLDEELELLKKEEEDAFDKLLKQDDVNKCPVLLDNMKCLFYVPDHYNIDVGPNNKSVVTINGSMNLGKHKFYGLKEDRWTRIGYLHFFPLYDSENNTLIFDK